MGNFKNNNGLFLQLQTLNFTYRAHRLYYNGEKENKKLLVESLCLHFLVP